MMETSEDIHTSTLVSSIDESTVSPSGTSLPTLSSLPPEILCLIFSYLSSARLTVCARVNKALGKTATSSLWKTIHFTQRDKLEQLLLTTEGLQGLVKNAEHIRELHIVREDMFDLFVPLPHESSPGTASDPTSVPLGPPLVKCTRLMRLVFSFHSERAMNYDTEHWMYGSQRLSPEKEAGVLALLESNPQLASIKLLSWISPRTVLNIAHRPTPSPHELEFATTMSRQAAKFLLDYLPQHITKLSLAEIEDERSTLRSEGVDEEEDEEEEREEDREDEEEDDLEHIQHHALRSLHLFGNLDGYETELLLPFLNTCSSLTEFKARGVGCFRNKSVRELLARLGIYMERLVGSDVYPEDSFKDEVEETDLAETIAVNQRLKCIDLNGCSFVGHLTIAAILGYAEYLQYLYLPCHSYVSAFDVQALLSQCKKLDIFLTYTPGFWCDTPPVKSLSAAEFLNVEWASLSLRRLGCVFRVPRPDDQVPTEYQDAAWNSPTVELSHEVQRQVYRHIAQQTNLVELNLGASINHQDPEHLWYSLDMTLESGLDELVRLKNLRRLTLHNMSHRLGTKELDWIVENLPKLRMIDGFYPFDQQLPEEIEQWEGHHYRILISGC